MRADAVEAVSPSNVGGRPRPTPAQRHAHIAEDSHEADVRGVPVIVPATRKPAVSHRPRRSRSSMLPVPGVERATHSLPSRVSATDVLTDVPARG